MSYVLGAIVLFGGPILGCAVIMALLVDYFGFSDRGRSE
jgi:hypothetical protein